MIRNRNEDVQRSIEMSMPEDGTRGIQERKVARHVGSIEIHTWGSFLNRFSSLQGKIAPSEVGVQA
jgi:hypothetical protein